MKNNTALKLSVWMITYNHEKYIAQAIESVLSQRTTFEFDLVIGEDFSTDTTRSICRAYATRFPGKINVLEHSKNIGIHANLVATLRACRGQYVATLEGDDYWTDPLKLQKQVDFMDANPDFVLCYQKTREINEVTGEEKITNETDHPETDMIELLERGWFMRTGSLLFRNGLIGDFPDWYFAYRSTDYMLHILLAEHGKIKFLNDTTSVYRRHETGITQSFQRGIIEFNEKKRQLLDQLNVYLGYRYQDSIRKHQRELYTASFLLTLRTLRKMKDIVYLVSILPNVNGKKVMSTIVGYIRRRV